MKPGNTSPYCPAWLGIYCGHYVQPSQSHRPCFETSGRSHLEQGHGAVWLSGAEPRPWPTFPHKVPCSSLLPHLPSQQTVPWRASCLQTTPGLSEKQARSKTSPKACLGPNRIHSTNAGGNNKIEEISNDPISKGSGRYSTLGFARWAVGLSPRAPLSCS